MPKLIGAARSTALATIPKWGEVSERDAIKRTYVFKGFPLDQYLLIAKFLFVLRQTSKMLSVS